MTKKDYLASEDIKGMPTQKRVVFIKKDSSAAVTEFEKNEVMTFPHLVVRGAIAFQILTIFLAIISLLFDAPLKNIADPLHTENPAKAPWYFLGLQELLHYFPPFIAGVLIPMLVIIALIIIPYFDVNGKAEGLWESDRKRTLIILTASTFIIFSSMVFFHAWSVSLPTLFIYILMVIPYFVKTESGWIGRLRHVSLTNWVMSLFVLIATVLTIIGVFFRGPYWYWSLPWIEGIY